MVNTEKKYLDGEYVGTTKLSWNVPEFKDYTRNKTWYIIAGIIGLLLLTYSIFTANFLFGVIIIIGAITLIKIDKTKPEELEFNITTKGILIGDKFYEYSILENFYIIYEPPEISNLFIEFKNFLKPRINIPLFDQDPITLRKLLKKYISEDLEKEGEPISETLGKILKL